MRRSEAARRRRAKTRPSPSVHRVLWNGSISYVATVGAIGALKDLWTPAAALAAFSFQQPWFIPALWTIWLIAYWFIADRKIS
jgi:hypothetical protein